MANDGSFNPTPERFTSRDRPFLIKGFRAVVQEWRKLPRQILQTPANIRDSLWPNWGEMREVYGNLFADLRNYCIHKRAR